MSGQLHDSHTRTEANRENARRSTGPKETASTRFNAVKHGLLAEGVTELDGPETFADFRTRLEAELKPVGTVETFLVRRIGLGIVRLKRAAWLEAEFLTAQLNPPVDLLSDAEAILAELDGDPGLPARLSADAVDALASTFARYETMAENRVFRALNQLERMQRIRLGERVPAPASIEMNVHTDELPLALFGNLPQVKIKP